MELQDLLFGVKEGFLTTVWECGISELMFHVTVRQFVREGTDLQEDITISIWYNFKEVTETCSVETWLARMNGDSYTFEFLIKQSILQNIEYEKELLKILPQT